jgi:small-conductance mechanosensitive channel
MDLDHIGSQLMGPFQQLKEGMSANLPKILGALLLFLFGLLLAWILRKYSAQLIASFQRLLKRRMQVSDLPIDQVDQAAPQVVSQVIFWGVVLFFLAASLHILGQKVVSDWINTLAAYIPEILAAVMLLFLGYLLGHVVGSTVAKLTGVTGKIYENLLPRVAKNTVIVTFILIAINQIGIKIDLLIIVLATVSAMFAGGIAIAFGLGAKTVMSNVIASHYVSKMYQVGQKIRIEEMEGQIAKIEMTYVHLHTDQGPIAIPAKVFSEKPSRLLNNE